MRNRCLVLCALFHASVAAAKPLTHGQKVATAGIVLTAAGYSTNAFFGMFAAATSGSCIACEGQPPPQDLTPLYGVIPLAGGWIQVGRHPEYGSDLPIYIVPSIVELVGVTLILAGSMEGRRR
ncbi:MAG: hypothetical protein JWM53_3995 [bacterium]|nr:hypothetical protein [bacterium]